MSIFSAGSEKILFFLVGFSPQELKLSGSLHWSMWHHGSLRKYPLWRTRHCDTKSEEWISFLIWLWCYRTFYSIFFRLHFKFFCTIFSITLVKWDLHWGFHYLITAEVPSRLLKLLLLMCHCAWKRESDYCVQKFSLNSGQMSQLNTVECKCKYVFLRIYWELTALKFCLVTQSACQTHAAIQNI